MGLTLPVDLSFLSRLDRLFVMNAVLLVGAPPGRDEWRVGRGHCAGRVKLLRKSAVRRECFYPGAAVPFIRVVRVDALFI